MGAFIVTYPRDRIKAGGAYCLAHHLSVEGEKRRDDRGATLLRYVRKDRRLVAVCGAPTLRRLAGGAPTVMTDSNQVS
jgi:hypothetical protein